MLESKKAINNRLISYQKTSTYVHITTDLGFIKLEPYTDRIIRITYTQNDEFSKEKSLGIILHNQTPHWQLIESSTHLKLMTSRITLFISKKTCAFTYMDHQEKLLLKEPDFDGKLLTAFDSYKTILDDTSVVEKIDTADGTKEQIIGAKKKFHKKLYHGKLTFSWQDDEALYGLGQQEEGILNLRGHRIYVHQANKKIAVPFLLSSKNYGLLLDTYSPLIFSDNEFGSYIYTEAINELDYYFIHGNSFDEVISGYRTLTGQATMLPKWAFGYMQSFERYENSDELINTVTEYRRRKIPIDSIVLDWQSWEQGHWGQKSFDKSRFNQPDKMIESLHQLGTHFMISIWPNMNKCTSNHKEFSEKGGLLQCSDIYNAFDKRARELYWNQAEKGLFDYGIDAWWTDSSEPYAPEWLSDQASEPDKGMINFHDMAKTYLPETHTNAYALVHGQTLYEGQRKVTDQKRVINLTRSGYTGQQRYGNILWSGDISSKWSTLKKQIPAGLNLCASGLPYWTLDIGGFFTKRSTPWFWNGDYNEGNKDPAYRELYTRWFQYATFLPILRAHGTDTRREVWQFGEEGTPYYDTIVAFIYLRYKLMPYIYSMAGMVTQKNYTILRLLAFNFNTDPKVSNIDDQFLFGDALMICPITSPIYERSVYLPQGAKWYDYWTNQKYTGGITITADAPINRIPIFVKSGAIIPTSAPFQHVGEMKDDAIALYIYSGSDGKFILYQDDGNNYTYENGGFSTINIKWEDELNTLTISDRVGTYKTMPSKINFSIYLDGVYCRDLLYTNIESKIRL